MSLLTTEEIARAILIFIRVGGIFFFLPVFGDMPTPVRFRMLLAIALSFAFYHLLPVLPVSTLAFDPLGLTVLIMKELLIGLSLGFVARIAFEAIVMAANLVGFQMGFGTASLMMIDSNEQMNSFAALHRIIAISIFFALNLHFIFLNAISESFQLIPLGMAQYQSGLSDLALQLTAGLFNIALQLAAPLLVALLFTMAALGLAARAVPQLNVFVLSFPISFFVGLLIYIASFPFLPEWMIGHFERSSEDMLLALKIIAPR